MQLDRREFGRLAALGTAGLAFGSGSGRAATDNSDRLNVNLFSKHLQFLDYQDMADATVEMGFDGVDLTVRPGGHVMPERAENDLPKAVEAMRRAGMSPKMLVSRVTSMDDKDGIQSLKIAAKLGFTHYRMGYFRPIKGNSLLENMEFCQDELDGLEAFNREQGLHGAYQNHAGKVIGSYVTDLAHLLDGRDPRWMGCQYDIRHASVDGGSSWPLGLSYLQSHIRTMPIKDFTWKKQNGVWKPQNVPLGQGMVDFQGYFKALREYGIKPLVSLHLEYDLGGAEYGAQNIKIPQKEVFAAMRRDLKRLRELWEASGS